LKFILIVGVDVDQQPGVYLSSDYFGATSEVAVMRPNRDLGILCKLCMQCDLRPVYHLEIKAPAGGANGAKVSSKAKKKPLFECPNAKVWASTVKYGGQGQAVIGPQQQQQLSKKQKEALLPSMKMCKQFKNYGCGKTSFFAGRACPGCTVTRDLFKEQEKTAKAKIRKPRKRVALAKAQDGLSSSSSSSGSSSSSSGSSSSSVVVPRKRALPGAQVAIASEVPSKRPRRAAAAQLAADATLARSLEAQRDREADTVCSASEAESSSASDDDEEGSGSGSSTCDSSDSESSA